MYRPHLVTVLAVFLLSLPAAARAQTATPPLTDEAIEDFLRRGRIVDTRAAGKGVTGSTRATLTLGDVTHDAHIQTIDRFLPSHTTAKGREVNFRDRWQFNVAAYRLDRLLDLRLVPVSIERSWRGQAASFTWWVDDVLMDEGERVKKSMEPPNGQCWSEQMQLIRLFDQLIDNGDRNLGNLLISRTWRLWAIDHTRAFRASKVPPTPGVLTRVDRRVLERLAALDFDGVKRAVSKYLTGDDVRALLSRRDAIVKHFAARGDAALFDRRDVATGCDAGAVGEVY